MLNILLPTAEERPLSFYLAMEEYVAAAIGSGFFVWRVAPTVIIGRNQDLAAEVNLEYCRTHGVNIVRRKSGGGCVYADRGNLMLSYITPEKGVENVFAEFLDRLAAFLQSLGLDAVKTEHNDVLVGGRKVSGNAFFVHPGASIVHGTLLHSVDQEALQAAITPPTAKLLKHGVASVRQRVANLVDLGFTIPAEELALRLADAFCDGSRMLTPQDIAAIQAIQAGYDNPAFILGKTP
ncbi:MAG: lipoate--protein ligase family protein [Bacteroidales bacterium]|nr:lipoate--protein ligase family protein [Bacteroidales bacterium]